MTFPNFFYSVPKAAVFHIEHRSFLVDLYVKNCANCQVFTGHKSCKFYIIFG